MSWAKPCDALLFYHLLLLLSKYRTTLSPYLPKKVHTIDYPHSLNIYISWNKKCSQITCMCIYQPQLQLGVICANLVVSKASFKWLVIALKREKIIAYKHTSQSSNIKKNFEIVCNLKVITYLFFDTEVNFWRPRISLVQFIWDESATNLWRVKFYVGWEECLCGISLKLSLSLSLSTCYHCWLSYNFTLSPYLHNVQWFWHPLQIITTLLWHCRPNWDLVEMKIKREFHSSMLDEVTWLMKMVANRVIHKVSQRGMKPWVRSFFVKTCC